MAVRNGSAAPLAALTTLLVPGSHKHGILNAVRPRPSTLSPLDDPTGRPLDDSGGAIAGAEAADMLPHSPNTKGRRLSVRSRIPGNI
jgi:hypothetical protein